MKSSKRNLILKIFGYLFISVILISCQNSSESNEDNTFSEYTNLSISINKFERTIMPETLSLANLSFKLYGAKSGEPQEVLKTWNNSNSITSSSITIKSGIWNFTMNAYSAGKLVLTSSKENVFLQGASNSLLFVLYEPNDMLGSVDVTFEFPAATGNIPGAKKIVAKLIKDSSEETEVDSKILIPENVTNDNTKQFVRYQNLNVEQGYYFLRFYIYQVENADYTNFHSSYIRVEPGLTSRGNESINSFFNKRHKLTLLLNGGSWNENYNVPNDFGELTNTVLPIGNATFQSDYWSDAILDGWYEMPEDGDLTEVPILTSLPAGCQEDKTLYAKWTIICEEKDIKAAFDNFPDGRFEIKLSTITKQIVGSSDQENPNLERSYKYWVPKIAHVILANNKKFVSLDFSETECKDFGEYVDDQYIYIGYCWGTTYEDSSSIVSIRFPQIDSMILEKAFYNCNNIKNIYTTNTIANFTSIIVHARNSDAGYILHEGDRMFENGITVNCSDGSFVTNNHYLNKN